MPLRESPSGEHKKLGLMALAVVSSIAASTCCLLPLVLVLAGITGAWMTSLRILEPVTPLLNGIAVATLIWAGYLVFRPQKECAVPQGATCGESRRSTKWIFLACATFVAALLIFPLIAPYFY
ncbi:MAG: mercuric transport protein [Proteobacteria bacterium]|nr:mercuric transport protein [Pseudomonadota bacterium]